MQLNLMHAELSRRLQANRAEHQRLWDTIQETKSEVGNLGGKLSNVQHVLDGTSNTARQVIESLVRDSRGALEDVRGESLVALQSAMLKHETDLRALYPLRHAVAEVTRHSGTVATGRGWLQRQRQRACRKLNRRRVLILVSKLILGVRRRTWEAVVPDLPPTAFELDFRMREGPSRDRKPRDVDTTWCSAWRNRTLTVIACKHPAIRDLLMAAEQEKRARARREGGDIFASHCDPTSPPFDLCQCKASSPRQPRPDHAGSWSWSA